MILVFLHMFVKEFNLGRGQTFHFMLWYQLGSHPFLGQHLGATVVTSYMFKPCRGSWFFKDCCIAVRASSLGVFCTSIGIGIVFKLFSLRRYLGLTLILLVTFSCKVSSLMEMVTSVFVFVFSFAGYSDLLVAGLLSSFLPWDLPLWENPPLPPLNHLFF